MNCSIIVDVKLLLIFGVVRRVLIVLLNDKSFDKNEEINIFIKDIYERGLFVKNCI